MADQTETTPDAAVEETNGGSKAAVRAAAIAAATGATAYAAKRALSARDQSQSGNREKKSGGEEESLFATMLATGWDAAKDSLLPFAEDAAATAGEYVARNGPELLRDKLVPRFIRAFEQAQNSDEPESDES